MVSRAACLLSVSALVGCAMMSEAPTQVTPNPPETYSLFGAPLEPAPLESGARDTLEFQLARAQAAFDRDPNDADAIVWLGRRTADLGRFRAAIAIYSEGLARHPNDARLYRHRGSCYLVLRRFESAIVDLDRAARLIEGKPDEIESDGRGLATGTLQSNVWYRLGLAYYLTGDFESARRAYERCLGASGAPDQGCAATYWLWQTLVRLDLKDEADRILQPIDPPLDAVEDRDYRALLAVYRGEVQADSLLATAVRRGGTARATVGYGIAGWRLSRHERPEAIALMRQVVAGDDWSAFDYVAAEAELYRLGERP